MNENPNKKKFENEEEALEFLIQRSKVRKQKKHFKELFDTAKPIQSPTAVVSMRTKIFRLVSAAAAITIGVVVAFTFLNKGQDAQLLASNMIQQTVIEAPDATRGDQSNVLSMDKQIEAALDKKAYKTALSLYESINEELDDKNSFFYAASLMKTKSNDFDKIERLLSKSITSKNEFYTEALWLGALNDIQNGQNAKAQAKLESLKASNYQSKKVNTLLSILSK